MKFNILRLLLEMLLMPFKKKGMIDRDISRDISSAKDYLRKKTDEKKRQRSVEKDARKELKGINKEELFLRKAYSHASPQVQAVIKDIWKREEQNRKDQIDIRSGNLTPYNEELLSRQDDFREEKNIEALTGAIQQEMRVGDVDTARELLRAEKRSERNASFAREETVLEQIEETDEQKA